MISCRISLIRWMSWMMLKDELGKLDKLEDNLEDWFDKLED